MKTLLAWLLVGAAGLSAAACGSSKAADDAELARLRAENERLARDGHACEGDLATQQLKCKQALRRAQLECASKMLDATKPDQKAPDGGSCRCAPGDPLCSCP